MGLFNFRRKKIEYASSGTPTAASGSRSGGGGSASTANANPAPLVPDFGGGRTTIPRFMNGGGGVGQQLPKRAQRDLILSETKLNSASVENLIDILIDAHPDVSYAVWNFLRLGNSGYRIKVRKPGSDKTFSQGEKLIREFIDTMEAPNPEKFATSRSFDKMLDQLLLSVVTRGAASLEIVMLPDKSGAAFLSPVDPATVDFKYEADGRFVPYQNFLQLLLDIPTFFYEALDARIDDPYGRSPLLGAINMVLFQIQVLNDIKAVVHNQGYPRFDIKIVEEVLLNRMPIAIRNNETEKQLWLNKKLQEIIDAYNGLAPDDTFVHFDSVDIQMAGGKGGGGGALIDPDKLMTAVDNLVMTGLKTLSTILGRRSTGNTESFAKIEIKLYSQGIKAIQGCVERILSRALTQMLTITGKQGIVEFRFNPIEIRTELEQAQFEQIALFNYAYMRDQGWIDQVEAAQRAVGHDPVAEPNFDVLANGTPNPATGTSGGGTTSGSGGSSSGSTGGGGSSTAPSGAPSGSTDNNPNAGGATGGGN